MYNTKSVEIEIAIGGAVLVVEHISIMNNNGLNPAGNNHSYEYLLKVYVKDNISSLYKKAFFLLWNKLIFCRKRHAEIVHNEIRVLLKKGDTIQKYIDNISNVICQVNNYLEFMQMIKTKPQKKNPVLKRASPMKSYVLAHKYGIRSKVWNITYMQY
jgi:hypothetical protein